MRVVDAHAVVAVDLHDLLQALLGRELHQLQRGAGDVAVHVADELGVHQHLCAEQLLHVLDLLHMLAGDEGALQIGDVLVDLEGVQRGVVPGVFHQRPAAGRHFLGALAAGHRAAELRDQFQQRRLAGPGHRENQRVAAGGQVVGQLLEIFGHRVRQQAHLLFHDAGGARHRVAEFQRLVEGVEADDRFEPVMHRRQADFELQYQAVGAPHVVHQKRLLAAQLDEFRLFLDGDGAQAGHVAACGQGAVVDRADAAEAATEQAAQRGAAEGRRDAAQLVATGPCGLVEVRQPDSGLGAADAVA